VHRAGGGGSKSKARKQKLLTKNEKLNEERKRSAADRAKDKVERQEKEEDGMHPSRRRRLH
jgi:nucleolar protein 6